MDNEETVDTEQNDEQSDSKSLAIQPSQAYANAGYPYGKNTRGKKKWLLEMKQG